VLFARLDETLILDDHVEEADSAADVHVLWSPTRLLITRLATRLFIAKPSMRWWRRGQTDKRTRALRRVSCSQFRQRWALSLAGPSSPRQATGLALGRLLALPRLG
jgi:hypothetical protein